MKVENSISTEQDLDILSVRALTPTLPEGGTAFWRGDSWQTSIYLFPIGTILIGTPPLQHAHDKYEPPLSTLLKSQDIVKYCRAGGILRKCLVEACGTD